MSGKCTIESNFLTSAFRVGLQQATELMIGNGGANSFLGSLLGKIRHLRHA